jgi:hypothetical protein
MPRQEDKASRPAPGAEDRRHKRPVTGDYSNNHCTGQQDPQGDTRSLDRACGDAIPTGETGCSIRHIMGIPVRGHS